VAMSLEGQTYPIPLVQGSDGPGAIITIQLQALTGSFGLWIQTVNATP